MKIRAVAIYFGVNLHKSHKGLSEISALNDLKTHDLVLFVNQKLTAYKALVSPELIAYYRSPDRLTLNDFKKLPELFGGERLVLSRDVERELMNILQVKLKEVG
jgi:hypothetical protein